MNSRFFNILRLLAVAITLFALVGERYLPKKQLVLHPSETNFHELFSDAVNGGLSEASWLDADNTHWMCKLRESHTFSMCGYSITFSEIPYKTYDLSSYNAMTVSLKYRGPATKLRVYLRNHNPAYSTLYNIEAAKFMSIVLRTSDFQPEATIQLSEFSVADWWKDEYDIPRSLSQPEFGAIVAIGIDQAPPLRFGDHDTELDKIVFTGDWVSNEAFYFFIIIMWMVILSWEAGYRLIYLYRRTQRDSRRLNELKAESDHYKEMSTTDPLTQINNRAGMQAVVDTIVSTLGAMDDHVLFVMDIDHFKRINDQRGHDAGDRILQAFARRIDSCIRTDDKFGRWGGEEFVLVSRMTEIESARVFAEKLRSSVHVYVFEPDRPLKISMSIGVAMALPGESFDEMFRRADEALYRAKALGRNCVVVDQPGSDEEGSAGEGP